MTTKEEIDDILYGYENDRRWDSLGEAANPGVKFLDHEQASQAIAELVSKARVDEARMSKAIATNYFDSTGFTIAQVFSERIKELLAPQRKDGDV